jgi:hypothetical protein
VCNTHLWQDVLIQKPMDWEVVPEPNALSLHKSTLLFLYKRHCFIESTVVHNSASLRTRRPGFDSRQGQRIFHLVSASGPALGAHTASCTMGTWGKARPERDADRSPPSSAEVKKEQELYLLSPKAPPRRVAGQLYFYFFTVVHKLWPHSVIGMSWVWFHVPSPRCTYRSSFLVTPGS